MPVTVVKTDYGLIDKWHIRPVLVVPVMAPVCQHVPVVHYINVIMGAITSQITSLTIVYSTVYSDADQRKHQSSASLAFVWGIHRGPVNSPHKWPVTRKMFPFDDVIMSNGQESVWGYGCLKRYSAATNHHWTMYYKTEDLVIWRFIIA